MRSPELDVSPLLLGDAQQLFAMRTLPKAPNGRIGVVILNSGLLHNVGPFGLSVDMSIALADVGLSSLRIDQSGKGESPKRPGIAQRESILRDFDDSLKALSEIGVNSVVLVGLCSGADDAVHIASRRESVCGVVLLDGYAKRTLGYFFRRFAPKIFSLKSWIRQLRKVGQLNSSMDDNFRDWDTDAEMIGSFDGLLKRGTKILAVFTRGQQYYNYAGQLASNLPNITNLENLEEVYFHDSNHTFSAVIHREAVVDLVAQWAGRNFGNV